MWSPTNNDDNQPKLLRYTAASHGSLNGAVKKRVDIT